LLRQFCSRGLNANSEAKLFNTQSVNDSDLFWNFRKTHAVKDKWTSGGEPTKVHFLTMSQFKVAKVSMRRRIMTFFSRPLPFRVCQSSPPIRNQINSSIGGAVAKEGAPISSLIVLESPGARQSLLLGNGIYPEVNSFPQSEQTTLHV